MKATLTFNLNAETDKIRHMQALKAPDLFRAIQDFSEFLRKKRKYELNVEAEKIEEELRNILRDYNLTLE